MESVSPKQDTPTEEHARHAERVRLMKISVMVFAGLVVFQLTLWGLDYIGAISLSAA